MTRAARVFAVAAWWGLSISLGCIRETRIFPREKPARDAHLTSGPALQVVAARQLKFRTEGGKLRSGTDRHRQIQRVCASSYGMT